MGNLRLQVLDLWYKGERIHNWLIENPRGAKNALERTKPKHQFFRVQVPVQYLRIFSPCFVVACLLFVGTTPECSREIW